MDRRDFLRFTGIASTSIMYPMLAPPAHAQAATITQPVDHLTGGRS